MRSLLALSAALSFLGCAEGVRAPVSPTTNVVYRETVPLRRPTRPPQRFTVVWVGDQEHRDVRMMHDPRVRQVGCSTAPMPHRETGLPVHGCEYSAPADLDRSRPLEFTLQNNGRYPEDRPCNVHLTLLQVFFGTESETEEAYEGGQCVIRIWLGHTRTTTQIMPPPNPTGHGMWGTSHGPPVPALDQTLP